MGDVRLFIEATRRVVGGLHEDLDGLRQTLDRLTGEQRVLRRGPLLVERAAWALAAAWLQRRGEGHGH